MAEDDNEGGSIHDEADSLREQVAAISQSVDDNLTPELIAEYIEYFAFLWADFTLTIVDPVVEAVSPPTIIEPEVNEDTKEKEHVYSIIDEGFRLKMSRGEEAFSSGNSLFKYFMTIEKMVSILVERLKTGGISDETEVRVAFYGFELGQRKAFESILNLSQNVVVVNYDAAEWGERFMNIVLQLAERGYGMPSATPRKPV